MWVFTILSDSYPSGSYTANINEDNLQDALAQLAGEEDMDVEAIVCAISNIQREVL